MEKQRNFQRLVLSVNVKWKKLYDSSDHNIDETKNISQGGICLKAYQDVCVGDVLQMEIQLPTGKVIRPTAKIAWVGDCEVVGRKSQKRYDVGVKFVDLSEIDREEIRKFETNPDIYSV